MRKKYTAVYRDWWMGGSHMQSLVRVKRMERNDGETVEGMLIREGIENDIEYLFNGHPTFVGEHTWRTCCAQARNTSES